MKYRLPASDFAAKLGLEGLAHSAARCCVALRIGAALCCKAMSGRISVLLDEAELSKLQARAKLERRSLSAMAALLLARQLEEQPLPPASPAPPPKREPEKPSSPQYVPTPTPAPVQDLAGKFLPDPRGKQKLPDLVRASELPQPNPDLAPAQPLAELPQRRFVLPSERA